MATIPILGDLVDAQAMARKHPDTFTVPSEHDLLTIQPGDFVKICRAEERFWMEVKGAAGRYLIGVVGNPLVNYANRQIEMGAVFRFQHQHIYQIMTVEEAEAQAAKMRRARR